MLLNPSLFIPMA